MPIFANQSESTGSYSIMDKQHHYSYVIVVAVLACVLSVVALLAIYSVAKGKIETKKNKAYFQFWASHIFFLGFTVYTTIDNFNETSTTIKFYLLLGIILWGIVIGSTITLLGFTAFDLNTLVYCGCQRCMTCSHFFALWISIMSILYFTALFIFLIPNIILVYYLYPTRTLIRLPLLINSVLYINSLIALFIFQCERLAHLIDQFSRFDYENESHRLAEEVDEEGGLQQPGEQLPEELELQQPVEQGPYPPQSARRRQREMTAYKYFRSVVCCFCCWMHLCYCMHRMINEFDHDNRHHYIYYDDYGYGYYNYGYNLCLIRFLRCQRRCCMKYLGCQRHCMARCGKCTSRICVLLSRIQTPQFQERKRSHDKYYDIQYTEEIRKKKDTIMLIVYCISPLATLAILAGLILLIMVVSDLILLHHWNNQNNQLELLITLVPTLILLFGSWYKLDAFFVDEKEKTSEKKDLLVEILKNIKKAANLNNVSTSTRDRFADSNIQTELSLELSEPSEQLPELQNQGVEDLGESEEPAQIENSNQAHISRQHSSSEGQDQEPGASVGASHDPIPKLIPWLDEGRPSIEEASGRHINIEMVQSHEAATPPPVQAKHRQSKAKASQGKDSNEKTPLLK